MNLETINKWLDEEYGCSFTRLEELHDFYFEKYCDLKKENNQLKRNWNKLKEWVNKNYDYYMNNEDYIGGRLCFTDMKDNMQELEQEREEVSE